MEEICQLCGSSKDAYDLCVLEMGHCPNVGCPYQDREPQPGDGPDYHQDHAAWQRRHAQPLPPPAPADKAKERSIHVEVQIDGFGTMDQMRQTAANAVRILAISFQDVITGTLDDGTQITFNHKGNPVASE